MCVCPRRFRARVFKFVVDRWENSIPKSFALCLCPVLLSRRKDARKTSPASTRSLSTVSQRPRVSLGRVFASVKRERETIQNLCGNCFFFSSFFILQLSAHNFHRGLARAKQHALRDPSFRTQHTPEEDDDGEDEERRELVCRDCLLLLPLYERALLSFSLKMCCLLCVMTSNKI